MFPSLRCASLMTLATAFLTTGIHAEDLTLPGAGQKVDIDLGTKRVNWTNAKWVVVPFEKTRDLKAFAGIKVTVTTDAPRGDAGVYVAVREEDGTWYEHPWAVNLTQKENTGTTNFADFSSPDWHEPADGKAQDQDMLLDVDKINAIAFGCVNPLGIGQVNFTVKEVTLIPKTDTKTEAIKVHTTGRLVDVNGTTVLPAGIFGGFNLARGQHKKFRLAMDRAIFAGGGFGAVAKDGGIEMLLNCYGDRGIAPPMLRSPKDWELNLRTQATVAAEAAKKTGKDYYVEWWNEPYLNWSNDNRGIYDPLFFNYKDAAEGAPVLLKTDGSTCPHLIWTKKIDEIPYLWTKKRYTGDGRDNLRRGKTAKGEEVSSHAKPFFGQGRGPYLPATFPPKDVKDGETYKAMVGKAEVELTAFTPFWPVDVTQFTYWSAKGANRFYNESMMVAGKALKAVKPDIVFLAGYCFRPHEDQWAAFDLEYKSVIDVGHEIVDGVTDHDYGGDAIKMPSSYEFITAYSMTRYNKWITSWNTECASGSDPAVHGEGLGGSADQKKFSWTARKLVHMLATVPDKGRSIAWFGEPSMGFSEGGEGVLFKMLMNLRGRLVQVQTGDPLLYAVSSIDGTDPKNPRPEELGPGKELVTTIFNDHVTKRAVDMQFDAPAGTTFTSVTLREPIFKEDGTIEVKETTETIKGTSHTLKAEIAAKNLIAVSFRLSGEIGEKAQTTYKQNFSHDVLVKVSAEKPSKQIIKIKPDDLKTAKRATIRLVVERLSEGEGVVTLNGKDIPLPKAVTPENAPWLREFAIDVASLKESNELIFKVTGPQFAGYDLACSSIQLECE